MTETTLSTAAKGAGVPGLFGGTLERWAGIRHDHLCEDRVGRVTAGPPPGAQLATDEDGTTDGLDRRSRRSVGGMGSDEIIGRHRLRDIFNGGPGDAPGHDLRRARQRHRRLLRQAAGVTVTLDGVLPTDPDIIADRLERVQRRAPGLPADASRRGDRTTASRARRWARPPPAPPWTVTARPTTASPGENDCVGEDIENVIGTPFGDDLTGNDPDSLYGQGPRVEPRA